MSSLTHFLRRNRSIRWRAFSLGSPFARRTLAPPGKCGATQPPMNTDTAERLVLGPRLFARQEPIAIPVRRPKLV